jgi:hypothetical protein
MEKEHRLSLAMHLGEHFAVSGSQAAVHDELPRSGL